MDNQDIVREFEGIREKIVSMEATVGELSKHSAVLASQFHEEARQHLELRTEYRVIADWVKIQMSGGITARVEIIEKDAKGTREQVMHLEEKVQGIQEKIQGTIKMVSGLGMAAAILWAVFGDAIKAALLAAVRKV